MYSAQVARGVGVGSEVHPSRSAHSGVSDLAYSESSGSRVGPASSSDSMIPDEVMDYLTFFKRAVIDQDVRQIDQLYEYGFADLTERYYREKFWPNEEQVAYVVGAEPKIFITLYKELYYRYVYGRIQRGPSLEHRFHSYQNYNDLFMHILDTEEPRPLNLPNRWLWDIIDEFVYQFQSFCLYKANPGKRSQDDLDELLHLERDVWNLYPVMNILYSVAGKSQINDQLVALKLGRSPYDVADDIGMHPLYFKLGYFALIGLLRIHVLLGDYKHALKTVENIEFEPKSLYNTVPSCLVTLHYYVGFVKMMMRNYQEAIKIFVNCLLYIQRTRSLQQQHQKTWQYDVIAKTNEQIYHLLGICMVLQPQRIDESVLSQLEEKHSEKMNRMKRGEAPEFESAFQLGCPKFLAPTITALESRENFGKEALQHQTRIFMQEIREQLQIPILRGYLKLYSSIPLPKLAMLMEVEESDLNGFLLQFKHKMCDLTRDSKSDPIEDDTTADLDFYVDKEMIQIADTKVGRRCGEYFIRHIQKLLELDTRIHGIQFKRPPLHPQRSVTARK